MPERCWIDDRSRSDYARVTRSIQSARCATSNRGVDVAGGQYVLGIDANNERVHVALDGAEPMRDARRNDDHVARSDPAALTSADRGSASTRTDQHLHRVAVGR